MTAAITCIRTMQATKRWPTASRCLPSTDLTMSWQSELEELQRRQQLAQQMGGAEGVARQHAQGKLTVRERLERLLDPGSLQEFRMLVGSATYDGEQLTGFVPKPSVEGFGRIGGRKVI